MLCERKIPLGQYKLGQEMKKKNEKNFQKFKFAYRVILLIIFPKCNFVALTSIGKSLNLLIKS